ncbi:MAG: type II toxin-antitoxin system prevent-host-death family antitoxin [Spirochaetaceae bacterium]|nr:MAG: type II toxin-antitoxin system prevent-host-death family antitoxin [Spirochaetaceae bacterium]
MARVVVNVSEAKAKLSKLIDMVYHGETVTIAKNNLPIVDLVPHHPRGRRVLGLARGKIVVPDDFDAESEELNGLFYGGAHDVSS